MNLDKPIDMQGRAAVVTGAASGLGRGTALALARAGADICAVDIDGGRLAVAHAGLDPMRIREWPNQAASEALLRDAVIRGAAHLFTVAPGLDLEPVRAALGSEAEGLDDVWAAWGRLQPELLATG